MKSRPYPNVVPYTLVDGTKRWKAVLPRRGRPIYLGVYDTPEKARRAVLIAQAKGLEAKAAGYRKQADKL